MELLCLLYEYIEVLDRLEQDEIEEIDTLAHRVNILIFSAQELHYAGIH